MSLLMELGNGITKGVFFFASYFGKVGVGACARWHKSSRHVALEKKGKKNPALGQEHIAFIAVIYDCGEKLDPRLSASRH